MIYVSKFKASDFMLFVGQEMIKNFEGDVWSK